MLEFIQLLKQRYQTVSEHINSDAMLAVYQQRIDQQILAEAFIRKIKLHQLSADQPVHIAVIGPTQAGKSSLVNVLLNSSAAGVSPLAGYTVHSQGFCHGVSSDDCSGLQHYFGRFQQVPITTLSKDRFDCYALVENTAQSKLLPPCVIWDTPDFDSIDAAGYSEALIRTIALADAIILVVSKEKYADQSVWDLMASIQPLQQPTLICVNKLAEGAESVILKSLQEKWRQSRSDEFPDAIALHYQKQALSPKWPDSEARALHGLTRRIKPHIEERLVQDYLNRHWQEWLEPIKAEQEALQKWRNLVDETIAQTLKQYQQDYLNHPQHYETFQNAMAALLNLLEIPGIAALLANTRKVITWPLKQLMKIGRSRPRLADTSHEVTMLNHLAEHFLIQVTEKLLERSEQKTNGQWWRGMIGLLRLQRQNILQDFNSAANEYHEAFQVQVEAAAHRLHDKLQEQPFVLNSLRATRVTTDAAAVAFSLQTGGIGLHDLIITPAMLSVTSLLAESAMGSYMGRIEAELKQQQLEIVRDRLFIECLQKTLYPLPGQLAQDTYFNIAPEQLELAEQQLKQTKHGLRLL